MRIAKIQLPNGQTKVALIEEQGLRILKETPALRTISDILHSPNPTQAAKSLIDETSPRVPAADVKFLAPIDHQEVWAAGVTYKRSQVARMEESEHGASHYDLVYSAPRPELFFKATPHRVAGDGQPVRIRVDTKWSVPEPEFALVINPHKKLVGYTIGNDMSARDIEGENPLYLPQAKVYNECCALGPSILLAEQPLDRPATKIELAISRQGREVFRGETNLDQMKRTFEDLIDWLTKDNSFPTGAVLLTGTGIVPPNDFTLVAGDSIAISVTGIGTLTNPVVQG